MTIHRSGQRRRLAALSFALLAGSAHVPAMAFEDVAAGVRFTLMCAGLMLRDPAQHVAVCNPVFPPPQLNSLIQTSGGASPPVIVPAPVVVPPPVVVVPPPPPPAPDPCACGACYAL